MTGEGVSPVPHEARAYQGQRAGVVTRVVAAGIDALVVGVALILGYAAIAALEFMVDPLQFRFPDPWWFLSVLTVLVVLVVYLTLAWWLSGRTYGCLLMGLRVVDGRERAVRRTLRLPRALLRAVAYAVFPIGLLWCAADRTGRSVQDIVLRTSVIYDWHARAPHRMRRRDAGGPLVG